MFQPIRYRAKRIDNDRWVIGHYFQAPLTDENSGQPQESGWYFLTGGQIKHCIEMGGSAFVVDPSTIGPIIEDIESAGWVRKEESQRRVRKTLSIILQALVQGDDE